MKKQLFALLIHDSPAHFDCLRDTLRQLGIQTYSISTCRQAESLLSQCKPDVIFVESCVKDGSWLTVQNLAEVLGEPTSIVVVGSFPTTHLYLSVMERGAFDFVAPPFERESLDFVVKSAALNTHHLRKALLQPAVA